MELDLKSLRKRKEREQRRPSGVIPLLIATVLLIVLAVMTTIANGT